MVQLRTLALEETFALRRAVLRGGDPTAEVLVATDALTHCRHLGAEDDGQVIATVTAFPCDPPGREHPAAWQLRFMAVDPAWQGRGIGHRLLQALLRDLADVGAELVWANARDSALGFYETAGFTVLPDSAFCSEATGLPHHVVELQLEQRGDRP